MISYDWRAECQGKEGVFMSKPVKIEHVLKGWEKKYGYIALSPKEREFFAAVKGERFMLSISGKPDYQRKIDDSWRIYIYPQGLLRT